jgi:hypothetical protein
VQVLLLRRQPNGCASRLAEQAEDANQEEHSWRDAGARHEVRGAAQGHRLDFLC